MTSRSHAKGPVPIVALDLPGEDAAMSLVRELGDQCRFYKVGSELFTAAGPDIISRLRQAGCDVMLDLKFHDIPNTISGAVASARSLGVRLITVHASGGSAMLRAAADAAGDACQIFAVTVLTSLDPVSLAMIWGRNDVAITAEVVRLATLAQEAGLTGVVASGWEVEPIKAALGTGFQVLVPGVRLADSDTGDQSRVIAPADARELGADYVVIGRTVTGASDRRTAMNRVLEELGSTAL